MATEAAANTGLTEEEQAALLELDEQMADTDATDPLFNPEEVVVPKFDGAKPADDNGDEDDGEEENAGQEERDPALDAGKLTAEEQAAADEKAKADKDAADAADAAAKKEPEPTAPRDPILVAQAPEGAEDRLKEIVDLKAKLADAFDDGDKTTKEYQAELEALNREERKLERAIDRYEIARDLEDQRITNERMGEINTFLREVSIPNDAKNMRFNVLNQAVITVANGDAEGKLSVREVMEQAYELCVKEGVLPALKKEEKKEEPGKKEAPPAKRAPIKAPPTLNNLPASDMTDTEDNRFAYLNRITDPDKREAAFAKLSPSDQEAYLASGG